MDEQPVNEDDKCFVFVKWRGNRLLIGREVLEEMCSEAHIIYFRQIKDHKCGYAECSSELDAEKLYKAIHGCKFEGLEFSAANMPSDTVYVPISRDPTETKFRADLNRAIKARAHDRLVYQQNMEKRERKREKQRRAFEAGSFATACLKAGHPPPKDTPPHTQKQLHPVSLTAEPKTEFCHAISIEAIYMESLRQQIESELTQVLGWSNPCKIVFEDIHISFQLRSPAPIPPANELGYNFNLMIELVPTEKNPLVLRTPHYCSLLRQVRSEIKKELGITSQVQVVSPCVSVQCKIDAPFDPSPSIDETGYSFNVNIDFAVQETVQ